ncbi:hypothetical protein A9P82_04980 [Arachidicoccus ginsenosidimutans]|uniref:hypothetical protein n=1 Tax=Arachidicoccus sp. BS20 TaxID=1850526 RepID=UPI0007F10F37|nr:hypothetical protein [Arachidicoccus sp. BS20]ANI88696.1 hypothetical protein A9P82_04980 [Arachidicoccus sp. BS20]
MYNKKLEAGLNININNKNYYLNNQFNAQALFQNVNLQTTGTLPNVQRGKMPIHFLENDFSLVKTVHNHILKIGTFIHYAVLPQNLVIDIPDSNLQKQQTTQKQMFVHPNVSYSFPVWRMSFSVQAGIQYTKGNYVTNLSGINTYIIPPDSLFNKYNYSLFQYYVLPKLYYDRELFHASLRFPVRTFLFNENDNLNNSKTTSVYPCPQLNMSYQLNAYWKLNALAGYDVHTSLDNLPAAYILENYREFNVGINRPSVEKSNIYSFGATYENAVHELFFYMNASYAPSNNNLLAHNYFSGYMNIIGYMLQNNTKNTVRLSARISKTIDSWKSTFSIATSYSSYSNYLVQQNIFISNKNTTFSLSPKIDARLTKWLILGYESSFIRNKLSVSNSNTTSPLNQFTENINIGGIVSKSWNFKFIIEHYNNQLTNSQSNSTLFSDFQIRYIPKKSKNWQYSITAYNLFNQKDFRYTVFNNASYMTQDYKIRPFNILAGVYFSW